MQITEQKDEKWISSKQKQKIAVISNKPDVTSKKIFRILKREYTVFYAVQYPMYGEELQIDLSNKKSIEGFLSYYGIEVMIICSSIFENAEKNQTIAQNVLDTIIYCIENDVKPIMLLEKYRIVPTEWNDYKLIGIKDAYRKICDEVAERILSAKFGLVVECPLTYGYDIKALEIDVLNILRHNEGLSDTLNEPVLIDEVGEIMSKCISMEGRINLDRSIKGDGEYKISNIDNGMKIIERQKGCVFNLIYQLMPNDCFGNELVAKVRIALGERLADSFPNDIKEKVDYIVPVPKTGLYYAMGLSKKLQIPYLQGVVKDSTDERSFQLLDINVRKAFLKNKLFPMHELLKGKSIVLVDEAIFTGTTLKMVCKMLWEVGVKRIFLGIPTPPCYVSCKYYVQPRREMLLEYIRLDMLTEYFDVDAVFFQSLETFQQEIPNINELCTECFARG